MEGLEIEIWERNIFDVEAVLVSSSNIGNVVLWAGGELTGGPVQGSKWYVLMDTATGSRRRQGRAYVGDWVVRVNGQFRIYKNDSINLVYHKKLDDRENLIRELFEQALTIDVEVSHVGWGDLTKKFTERAMAVIEGRLDE